MKSRMKSLTVIFFFIIASCAVITVNIYFPEKDIKEAYKNLEKELMDTGKNPDEKKPESRPQSSILFELIPSAYAQESELAGKISEIVKKMPDVVMAYKRMGERLPDIDRLRDSGLAGEGNKGLLVVREGKLSPADMKLFDMENADRQTVMKGMARAMIRINRDRESAENINKRLPEATEYFAAVRRDNAKKGWWIQDPDGNWSMK
jgi:hypothetical protein